MYQMTVEVSDDLAQELHPYRDRLPVLLRLGLAEWRKHEPEQQSMAVEDVLRQLSEEGKLIRPKAAKKPQSPRRRSLVHVTGKPVSELVIEQRQRP